MAKASPQTSRAGWLLQQSAHAALATALVVAMPRYRGGRCPRCRQSRVGSRCGSSAWDPTSPGRGAEDCRELPSLLAPLGARQSYPKHSQPSCILLYPSLWHRAGQLPVQLWMLNLDTAHCTFHHEHSPSSRGGLVQLSSFWCSAEGMGQRTSTISDVGISCIQELNVKGFKKLLKNF